VATKQNEQEALSPGEYIELLEQTRHEFLDGASPFRGDTTSGRTKEQIAESKRRFHTGGDPNHRFEGERYLQTENKEIRRKQLRKLIDEGGQTTVGGTMPSHPDLARWHSKEFGLTDEEIDRLEHEDALPETLVKEGFWFDLNRDSHWAVALASALVGEGSKRLPGAQEYYTKLIENAREEYAKLGIENVDRAVQLLIEHAPFGADEEHARFAEEVIRECVDTAELQEEARKAFILTMHRNARGRV
jgi:pyrroloquinoline quinone (PQQ) biosynthesis protein C